MMLGAARIEMPNLPLLATRVLQFLFSRQSRQFSGFQMSSILCCEKLLN